jgi:hypothetical protein
MRLLLSRPRRSSRTALVALAGLGMAVALGACGTSAALPQGGTTGQAGPSTTAGKSSTTTTVAPTTTTVGPAGRPLPQPSSADPLTIVEIGDSLGEDLGFGLGDVFSGDPWVHVVQAAKGDTGLSRPDYFNWPASLATLLQQYHPGLVVVFLGANDGQGFDVNGQVAEVGDALWTSTYKSRVATMMAEAVGAGARVLWVGMPIMQDPSFWQEMQMMNGFYQAEAAVHPGVQYFPSWPLFADAQGQYVGSIDGVVLRAPDGIHIANGGDDRLANALVSPIERTWKISLFPPDSGA